MNELVAQRAAYTNLATTFNPTAFNATNLALLARNAGFTYLTWVAEHCDGYSNFDSTNNYQYSIMSSPYGKDTFAMMKTAFQQYDMNVGVYMCPSFWNRNDYFYPNASSSFGTCCQPNYNPPDLPNTWSSFVNYLHGEIVDLANKYQPDHYWFDSGTYPPEVDTHIEEVLTTLRTQNPNVVVQVRDGGVWHDYIETVDHSEDDAHDIMGMSYIRPYPAWEVPGTLGEQWAYDPHATYESAEVVIRKLIGVIAKGGNFLLNIGLDPTGVWAPSAVDVLTNMSTWFSFNSDAVYNTTATWPYEYFHGPLEGDSSLPLTQYFVSSNSLNSTYVFLVDDRSFPIQPSTSIILPHFKPSLLQTLPTAISKFTPTGLVPLGPYTLDETGITFNASQIYVPGPVLLGTYRHNYSSTDINMVNARNARRSHWPQTWWKVGKNSSNHQEIDISSQGNTKRKSSSSTSPFVAGGSLKGATGSNSLNIRRLTRERNIDAAAVIDNAPCATRGCSVYTSAGYTFIRSEGICYRSSLLPNNEPSAPISLYYNNQDDNAGSINTINDGQNWSDVDLECWIYVNNGTNRLPLELWHSTNYQEYWTLSDPQSRAEAQAMGYTLVTTLGYVDPTPPGGVLPPDAQAATASSWAYTLRIDW